jgi:hypothetical protein
MKGKVRKKRSQHVMRFNRAARETLPYSVAIPRDAASIRVNAGIEENIGPAGHRAIEEIRTALTLAGGGGRIKSMIMEYSGGGAPDSIETESQREIWSRFKTWYWILSLDPALRKARDATILFVQGEKIGAIETALKVRRGHGLGRCMIQSGARNYAEMAGWVRCAL